MASNGEQSVTIQLELPSDQMQMPVNNSMANSSLLIPGYLLVKSCDENATYQLQQTVMAINVESDANANLDLSTLMSCNIQEIETQTTISGALENILLTNGIDISSNLSITNEQMTKSKIKRKTTNRKKVLNNRDKLFNNCMLNNCDHISNCHNNSNSNIQFDKMNGLSEKVNKISDTIGESDAYVANQIICNESDFNGKKWKQNQTQTKGDKQEKRLPPSRLVRVNCPVCNKEFKKTYLKEHMKIHEEDKPYKCMTCGKTYRWRTLLRNHKKTHLANNPFTCPVCDLRMSSKFSVQQHILKVHENADKKYECAKCAKKYVTIHQLKAHEKFHSEDRTRQCEYCGKVYKHIASLERHRRLHKGEENSLDLRLKCSSCGLICHSKTHYTAHQRIHTGEKPFVCETCGKCYRQIAQLNQHKIVHTDLRPFKCTICERTFRCRSNLQLHMDHHKGEKRHTCSYCNQKFFSYPNMLKHVRRNHLGLRPFKCELCENKSFCEKQELQNHMRTHTGERRPTPKRKRLPLPTPLATSMTTMATPSPTPTRPHSSQSTAKPIRSPNTQTDAMLIKVSLPSHQSQHHFSFQTNVL